MIPTEVEQLLAEVPSDWQRSMLERAAEVLPAYPGVLAVLVTGSVASSAADRFSDLDLLVVVAEDDLGWWDTGWKRAAEAVAGPLVLANPIGATVSRGYVVINSRWEHLDLVIQSAAAFTPPAVTRGLFDPQRLATAASGPKAHELSRPYYPEESVELFLYLLGVATATLGRGEVLLAHAGVAALRDQLVCVMLGENGIRRSGGAKKLNPYLSKGQRELLLTVSAAAPDVSDILRAYHAITVELVTRARTLAAHCGGVFPERMLEATDAHLTRELGDAWTALGPLPTATSI